jgi:ketosteroid isomerase-like protein
VSNKEIVQELYDAFGSSRWERVLELCDPQCVITQDDALPWGGRYEGFDGIANFGLALAGSIDSAVTPEGLFEAGDRVVQHGRTRGTVRANGAAFDIAEVHVWTLRDGKAVAAEFYIDTPAMLEALGGRRA